MTRQTWLAGGPPARVPGRLPARYETMVGGVIGCLGTVGAADEAVAVAADGPEAAR